MEHQGDIDGIEFCKQQIKKTEEGDLVIHRNPASAFMRIGWTMKQVVKKDSKMARELMAGKAYSLKATYPGSETIQ